MDCSPPGSSVLGDAPGKTTAMPSSRGSSQPRDTSQVFHIVDGFIMDWATREAQMTHDTEEICLFLEDSVKEKKA